MFEEVAERAVSFSREAGKLARLRFPGGRHRVADAAQHDVSSHGFELHVTARRQEREATLNLPLDVFARAAEQSLQAGVEAKLTSVLTDEVQYETRRLAISLAQAAAELLKEEDGAFGGAEEEQGLDVGKIDAFVEEVHREEDVDLAATELRECLGAFFLRAVSPNCGSRDAVLVEHARHEARMGDTDAEAEGAHTARVVYAIFKLAENEAGPDVVGGVDVSQAFDVVAGAARPIYLSEVGAVVDAVVLERHEAMLIDRVP